MWLMVDGGCSPGITYAKDRNGKRAAIMTAHLAPAVAMLHGGKRAEVRTTDNMGKMEHFGMVYVRASDGPSQKLSPGKVPKQTDVLVKAPE